MVSFVKKTYRDLIVSREKATTFWILFSFLPTFIAARLLVYYVPSIFIDVGGTHIHHLAWGVFLLAIAGYLGLVIKINKYKPLIAIVYGIGLALAFDEFGMWLRLKDDYYLRHSYDAMLIILFWLINTVYFADFWLKVWLKLVRLPLEMFGKQKVTDK